MSSLQSALNILQTPCKNNLHINVFKYMTLHIRIFFFFTETQERTFDEINLNVHTS